MPIWLRRFTFSKLQAYYEKQNEDAEKASTQRKRASNIKKPTFITKASK